MPDLPAQIVLSCFALVLGLFVLAAVFRGLRRPRQVESPPAVQPPPLASPTSPYAPGRAVPPPLPDSVKVPTHYYRRFDLAWMAILLLIFFGLTYSQLHAPAVDLTQVSITGLILSIGFWAILAGLTLLVVLSRVRPVQWLGLRWRKWPHALWLGPVTMLALWGVLYAMHAVGYMQWMQSLGAEAEQDAVTFFKESTDVMALGVMAVGAVIGAPLCEELVFRGYLYPAAKRFTGPWFAAFCSALLFAAAHANLTMLLPLFLLGLVFVWLYERTGSLWAPIAAHFCVNGATVVLQLAVRYLDLPVDL